MKKFSLLVLMVLVLSSCSSKNNAKEKFTVGMECNYAPFNWTSLSQTKSSVKISPVDYCDGYDVMVAQKIAEGLNLELEIKKIAWEGLEPALSSNEIDAIIAGMTDTEERRQNVDFSEPYYESEMVMIVKKDSHYINFTSIQDFKDAKILGQLNTLYDQVIDQIEGVIHATPLPTYPLMLVSLQSNEVDGLTAELPVAKGIISSNPDLTYISFEEGKGFKADTSVSIAVKNGNKDLLDKIQEILNTIDQPTRTNMMLEAVESQPSGD